MNKRIKKRENTAYNKQFGIIKRESKQIDKLNYIIS